MGDTKDRIAEIKGRKMTPAEEAEIARKHQKFLASARLFQAWFKRGEHENATDNRPKR